MNRMVRAGLVVALLFAPAFAWAQAGEDGAGEPAAEGAASAEAEAAADPAPAEAQPPAVEEQPADEAEPSDGDDEADEDAYDVRVRDLEERVNQLKMRIYQSKARLVRLQEAVMHGVVSGARARLVHRNEMGSTFKLQEAHYFLDGAPLKQMSNLDGSLADQKEIELFQGQIVPGNHQLSVNLVYAGNGYGIFSYLKGYRFKIRSSYTFSAEEGKFTEIKVVGYERGGITTDLRERPTVRYDVDVMKDTARSQRKEQADKPVAKGN
ncbi:MAG: dihydrolipoamide acetyltransferase [Myxococcota bacterium]|nr:dihydrolipoamide acetyltransferase [Myxococcota bacterium]